MTAGLTSGAIVFGWGQLLTEGLLVQQGLTSDSYAPASGVCLRGATSTDRLGPAAAGEADLQQRWRAGEGAELVLHGSDMFIEAEERRVLSVGTAGGRVRSPPALPERHSVPQGHSTKSGHHRHSRRHSGTPGTLRHPRDTPDNLSSIRALLLPNTPNS